MSREQMTRVVEFTNRHAYLDYHNNKLAGAHRYVEFPGGPARVDEVIKQATGSPEPVVYRSLADYQHAPASREKQASWEQLFGVEKFAFSKEATGEAEAAAAAFRELHHLRSKLASAIQQVRGEMDQGDVDLDYARSGLVEHMKRAMQEGATLRDLVRGMAEVSTDPAMMQTAFKLAHPTLMRVLGNDAGAYTESMKTASAGVLDREHPLLAAYANLIQTSAKMAAQRMVLTDLREKLAQVNLGIQHVKEATEATPPAAPAESVGQTLSRYAKGAWNHMDEASKFLNREGAELGKGLGGENSMAHRIGGHAGTAIAKGLPALAAAGLAYKGYQHLNALGDSRLGRAVKSFVPGTDEAMMDEMRIRQMYGADAGYPMMGY